MSDDRDRTAGDGTGTTPSAVERADAANGEPGASAPLDTGVADPADAWEADGPGTGRSTVPQPRDGDRTEDEHMAGTPTDALERLEQEHRQVEQLLEQLADSDEGDRRRQLVDELTAALEDHMAFEESQLYPIVREVLGEEDAEEARIEHDLTRDGLSSLQSLVEEPGFGAAVAMLQGGIGHHVEEEEQEIFPRLRREAADAVGELTRAPAGTGSAPDDDGPSKDELYRAAQEADVPGRSTMTKDELARALQD